MVDDKLTEEELIKSNIDCVMNGLDEKDKDNINGVYLFGSVCYLKGRKMYRREPSDLDLYFWVENFRWGLKHKIKNLIDSCPKPYGLEVEIVASLHHPFDNEDMYISKVHVLYLHPRLKSFA